MVHFTNALHSYQREEPYLAIHMKHVVEELLTANTHGRFVGLLRQQFNLENGETNTGEWRRVTAKLLLHTLITKAQHTNKKVQ